MKYLIFGFILLLLAIWLGLEISRGPGYVLVAYRHWSVETSLWVAVVLLIMTFLVLYFIFRTLGRTARISKNLKQWKKMRRYRKARQLTTVGLCELAEGDWEQAERTLLKSAPLVNHPLINYLSAAKAAQAQEAYDRRDNYLRKAHIAVKDHRAAVGLTQAQLQINSNQWEQALATLKHLHQKNPDHAYTLRLLKIVYQHLEDWSHLQALLPRLRKHKAFSAAELTSLEKKIYLALLVEASKKNRDILLQAWKTVPRYLQQDHDLIVLYTSYLIDHHEDNEATQLIEHALKKQWDSTLVKNFGLAKSETPGKQLTTAETWFKKYPSLF